ncbi:MAG: chorismate mutase [Candidatus Ancillula sp.]|jgi:chorismate mutase|nr:chorismate mutase [Candidatus Ancillula sp.]
MEHTGYSFEELRGQIDQIDEDIMMLLSKRFSVTEEIGVLKSKQGLDEFDSAREAKQFKQLKRLRNDLNLPAGIEKDIWGIIMRYSKERHRELKEGLV